MSSISSCRSAVLFCALVSIVNFAHAMGVTPSEFSVGQGGAANYSIPIQVPPGTAGMQPNLSLVYNSQSGNGIFGQGWSLDGLPVIHRCPATIVQDGFKGGINYDSNDRLCLNGQRLVAVSGEYGAEGTEYRTEIESFSKIISYGQAGSGPASFKVWSKSGQVMEFGVTEDSRIEALNRADVRVWANNKVQDTVGNYLKVAYDEKTGKGQYCPTNIDYTANDAEGLTARRSVRLESIARTDITTQYVAGSKIVTDRLISNIKTYVGVGVDEVLVKDYRLAYEDSPSTDRSRIQAITECDATGSCLPATTFDWFDGYANSNNGSRFQYASTYATKQEYLKVAEYRTGDFNGDGLTDTINLDKSNFEQPQWVVRLSNGNGTFTPQALVHRYSYNENGVNDANAVIGDYNADGLSDVLLTDQYLSDPELSGYELGWLLYTSDGDGTFTYQGPVIGSLNLWRPYEIEQLDYDGDGRGDVFVKYSDYDSDLGRDDEWVLFRGNGDSTFTQQGSAQFIGEDIAGCLGDFNGDGKTDLCHQQGQGFDFYLSKGNGTFTYKTRLPVPYNLDGFGNKAYTADFNGDGNTDFVMPQTDNWMFYLSKGDGTFTSTPTFSISDKYRVQVPVDYNGDGFTDLLLNNPTGEYSYNNTGSGWAQFRGNGNGSFTYEGKFTQYYQWNSPITGDFDGDGKGDFVIDTTSAGWYTYLSKNAGEPSPDLITTATDGLGAKTQISYKPLTDSTVYSKGSGAVYPEIDIQAPQYVVSNYAMSDGIGGMYQMNYQYTGARAHLLGRGSLGFKSMTVTDSRTGISTTSNYRQDYPFTGSAESTETRLSNNTLIKRTSAAYVSRVLGAGSAARQFVYADNSIEETFELDGSPVTTVSTTSQYDDYGNPTQLVVDSNDGYVKTTLNTYINDTTKWFLGRLTKATVTSQTPVQGAQTRTSSFAYDAATGLLSQEVIEPGNPAFELTTEYDYDGFGNKTSATISGAGITPRTTTTTYDTLHHTFPKSVTNAAGHTENRSYWSAFGKRVSLTGPNGLTTTWHYDGFGRLKWETRADGTVTGKHYVNCSSDCPFDSPFYVITTSSGSPTSTMYFDKVGREIMAVHQGFNGVGIYKKTEYDNLGRVLRTSRNYYPGETIYWTNYTYDVLGRVLSEINPDNSRTDIQYSGLTTTTINDKNQSSIKTKDSQGQLIVSTDDANSTTAYDYDPFGNLLAVTGPAGNVSSMSYDFRGRKIGMNDPDMGVWSYAYNVLGELVQQTDAKLQVVSMEYDVLGRLVKRTEPEGISTWEYDTAIKGLGKLTKSVSSSGIEKIQSYDVLGRPDRTTTIVSGTSYVVQTSFDSLGRVDTLSYPTGLKVKNVYTALGYLKEVRNAAASNELYWQLDAANARGQTTQYTLGNGLTTVNSYDDDTGRIKGIITGGGIAGNIQNLNYNFDTLGNLTSRNDVNQSLTETFTYDSLNRLTETNFQGGLSKTYQYDSLGNITYKSDVGDYTYGQLGAGPHAVTQTSRLGIVENTYSYDANGNQIAGAGRTLSYTSFNKPLSITKGSTTVSYAYDAERNRIRKLKGTEYTVYIGKLYEKVLKSGVVEHKQYINAGGKTFAVFNTKGSTTETRYLHKDHLGSTDVITNEAGEVVERQSFDPHGQRRNTNWQDGFTYTGLITSRGFTGHEMDDEIGLINMNARMYDPVLGRFLSPDTYVQFPDNAQSYNRYTYVNNNPLSYTDPSGHFLKSLFKGIKKLFKNKIFRAVAAIAAGILTGGLVAQAYFSSAILGGSVASLAAGASLGASIAGGIAGGFVAGVIGTGSLKGGLAGAITGGLFGYVGGNFTGGARLFGHGLVGGVSSELQGGKFSHGFFGQLVSKSITIFASDLKVVGKGIASVVAGGAAAAVAGGKFANGAVTGAFGYLFNQCSTAGCRNQNRSDTVKRLRYSVTVSELSVEADIYGDSLFDIDGDLTVVHESVFFERYDRCCIGDFSRSTKLLPPGVDGEFQFGKKLGIQFAPSVNLRTVTIQEQRFSPGPGCQSSCVGQSPSGSAGNTDKILDRFKQFYFR